MSSLTRAADVVVAEHAARSRSFTAAGVTSSVLEAAGAAGDPVVCLHGVPTSSFLYRKVVPALGHRGVRAFAFDLPGMGLAGCPDDFDYTWTGLGAFAARAVDALGIDRYHLLVHDIGGPVGFELTARHSGRVRTLTVLNTMASVASFRKPWPMAPFAVPGIGDAWLAGTPAWMFVKLMRHIGIYDQRAVDDAELAAHLVLLRRTDHGSAFLKIMRNFETTVAKEELYREILADPSRPRQVLWGVHDRALPSSTHGADIAALTGSPLMALPGRHFVQEDNAAAIADAVAAITVR